MIAHRQRRNLELELVGAEVRARLFNEPARRPHIDRFELIAELGRGGTGTVYEAFDPLRRLPVAIKVLHSHDGAAIYRIKREFRSLCDVAHSNLVGLHEMHVSDGLWFFSMDLVRGRSFLSHVRHSATLQRDALVGALRQLTAGLEAIHALGKLHRDLKPSNVLVERGGRVVLLDFGLVIDDARERHASLESGLAGTPIYMAPELLSGAQPTQAGDWYALGVMLYEALTGRPPARDPLGDVPPPDQVADTPRALGELAMQLLARDPAARGDGHSVRCALANMAASGFCASFARTSTPPRSEQCFLGRSAQLARLAHLLQDAREGRARFALIEGESGIGKTSLMEHFIDGVKHTSLVLRGRCHVRELLPYKGVDAVVDALTRQLSKLAPDTLAAVLPVDAGALVRVFPTLARIPTLRVRTAVQEPEAGPAEDAAMMQIRAFAALKELLCRLSAHQVIVIAIDDLHWSDADSAQLLTALLVPPATPRTLIVGTFRSEDRHGSAFLQEFLRKCGPHDGEVMEHIELGPLCQREAEALALQWLEKLDPLYDRRMQHAAHVAREAAGIPFLITRVAHQFRHDNAGARPTAAPSLSETLTAQLQALPPPARSLLQLLAVAARPTPAILAMQLAGLRLGSDAEQALRNLLSESLVRSGPGNTLDIYHDRIRVHIVSGMSESVSREVNARLADALESAGVDPARLVELRVSAGQPERAVSTAERAGDAAARQFAVHQAAALYQRAAAIALRAGDPRLVGLLRKQADTLVNAGRECEAIPLYLRAADLAQDGDRPALRRAAAQQCLRTGQLDLGLGIAQALLQELGYRGSHPSVRVATLVANRARIRAGGYRWSECSQSDISAQTLEALDTRGLLYRELLLYDPIEAGLSHSRFLLGALRAGEPRRVLEALCYEVIFASFTGHSARAQRVLSQVRQLSLRLGTPYARAMCTMVEAGSAMMLGRVHEVLRFARESHAIFSTQCPGSHWELHQLATFRYGAMMFCGSVRELCDEANALVKLASDRQDRFLQGTLLLAMGTCYLAQDTPDAALDFLRRSHRRHENLGFGAFDYIALYRSADALAYRGDATLALCEYLRGHRKLIRTALYRGQTVVLSDHWCRARLALAAYVQRRDEADLRLAERLTRFLERQKRLDARVWSSCIRAGIEHQSGRTVESQRVLTQLLSECEATGLDAYASYVRYCLGLVLAGDHGAALRKRAETEMTAEGIRNPRRWIATYLPGFA